MDIKKFNYLDWESVFGFLKYYAGTLKSDQPTKRKINSIFRRLDVNADQKLAFNEFAEAIKPIDVYFTDVDDINLRQVSPRKYSQAELAEFKRQLRQEHREHKSAERSKPLRTFKSILSSKDVRAIKELQSPIKRQQNDIMIHKNEQEDQDYSPIRKINQDQPMKIDDLSTVKKFQEKKTSDIMQGAQSTQKIHYYNFNNENSTQKNIRFSSGIKNNQETPIKESPSAQSIRQQQLDQNNEKSSEKQSISAHKQSQFSIDSYSPEKFAQDSHQIGNIHNSLKLIEHEKDLLFSKAQDFNILDAFRAFDIDNKGYISQVELISGLLEMKIEHSQSELNTFFKYYDSEGQKKIRFADFSRAFLPSDKDKSLQILKRDPLNVKVIKRPTLMFLKNTFLQYIVVWRILLRQMWEIDNYKKRYAQANCFDVEKPFFDMDKNRLGKISKDNLKQYMIQKQDEQRYSDQDIDMIFNYFNRRELPQVSFDDVRVT
ncbi:ef hand family protein [Stylonychia lemnae]|uniref:Ef hand family protein n=1 Tax=Stylonychia lemnae TaxID=5949 RepID=A0A078ACS8_STYLE|nr:ef hand family protein [Stylonychia lemnae]|eukprot:CDW79671.1 ef hand family protein [Stylonychia lemnae]